jgi:hypothetical protein
MNYEESNVREGYHDDDAVYIMIALRMMRLETLPVPVHLPDWENSSIAACIIYS